MGEGIIYNNPYPGLKRTETCPQCHKTFEISGLVCAVVHYGNGCCHYGDKEIITAQPEEIIDMFLEEKTKP